MCGFEKYAKKTVFAIHLRFDLSPWLALYIDSFYTYSY